MTMEQGFDPRSITVLVVDDEPRLVDVLRLDLEIEGYRVVAASNGYEALDRLKDDLPDLVVLDVMMPEMDGFETLRHIREVSNVPVVMLTVRQEESDRIKWVGDRRRRLSGQAVQPARVAIAHPGAFAAHVHARACPQDAHHRG